MVLNDLMTKLNIKYHAKLTVFHYFFFNQDPVKAKLSSVGNDLFRNTLLLTYEVLQVSSTQTPVNVNVLKTSGIGY